MAAKTNYLANALLDLLFGASPFSAPATLYIGLFTSLPTASASGSEPSGGSYARAAVTNNTVNFPAASAGAKSNATVITFAQATAAWGNVVGVGIFDALSGGNLLYFAPLTVAKNVASGDQPSFAVGSLAISES